MNVDFERLEEFCIKNLKTNMRIFWCCPRAFKANILVCSSTSGHFQWKLAVIVSLFRVKGQTTQHLAETMFIFNFSNSAYWSLASNILQTSTE